MKRLGTHLAIALTAAALSAAADQRGVVRFGGLPLPGATVTATAANGGKASTVSGTDGAYLLPNLADGAWSIRVEMLCFETAERSVTVAEGSPPAEWDLAMRPVGEISAQHVDGAQPAAAAPSAFQQAEVKRAAEQPPPPARPAPQDDDAVAELSQQAADGFLINGSMNNGASTPFAIGPAFGNFRKGPGSLYNGSIGVIMGNSAWDARQFSLTGQNTAKPDYARMTGILAFGGPLRIPHLIRNGPSIMVNYQWTRNRDAMVGTGLMPTEAERAGDLGARGLIPRSQISPQALALLGLYPLPNFTGGSQYNFQVPLTRAMHQDSLQSRANKQIGSRDQLSGSFAFQSTRGDSTNLFGFLDTTKTTGLNAAVNWRHALTPRLSMTLGAQFSRLAAKVTPFFSDRSNVSEAAGIAGNNQEPVNWGPPALNFSSGITPLSSLNPSFTRNQTTGVSIGSYWGRGRHNLSFGADIRRQQFNYLGQQEPRGTFTFTGAAAGSDFAGFLLGVPDAASIAFGNADKYFRSWFNDAYFTDDWRVSPALTINAGMRWEYGAPWVERYGRIVNLDIAGPFTSQAPVLGTDPKGALTGRVYPASLMHPDRTGLQPRIGFAWRPLETSSLVVRGGYGVYYNTSVYEALATELAQQPPLSRAFRIQNSAATPLTLANGFTMTPPSVPNTFAVDPDLQIGHSQNWQLSVQRDLPAALVMVATYSGGKGTRGLQGFLPNTFPAGAADPCPSCPRGFTYVTSNGNSSRHAGQLQLRRRLRAGVTGSLQYTYAKAIDNAVLGGRGQGASLIAQNWLDLSAERARSNFDQRHAITAQFQYTSGMGTRGGLFAGRAGRFFREWTLATQITAGTGLPLTPTYFSVVEGTGLAGSLRPDYTGAPLYDSAEGLFLNPTAFAPPAPGRWGNAGRNSITGPRQLVVNSSFGRTFRHGDRLHLDVRIDASNALNQVTYQSWNTIAGNAQFGFPTSANPMRTVQTTIRARF